MANIGGKMKAYKTAREALEKLKVTSKSVFSIFFRVIEFQQNEMIKSILQT